MHRLSYQPVQSGAEGGKFWELKISQQTSKMWSSVKHALDYLKNIYFFFFKKNNLYNKIELGFKLLSALRNHVILNKSFYIC